METGAVANEAENHDPARDGQEGDADELGARESLDEPHRDETHEACSSTPQPWSLILAANQSKDGASCCTGDRPDDRSSDDQEAGEGQRNVDVDVEFVESKDQLVRERGDDQRNRGDKTS